MKNAIQNHWQWVLLWALVAVSGIMARPPIPIDETRYLSVAWEMWQSGNYLVPHSNGLPYSHKPPLLFWLINSLWLVTGGPSEFVARLVGPLCTMMAVFLSLRLAVRLWPNISDVRGDLAFVLLGLVGWSLFGSLTMFDTLLTCCLLFGLLGVHRASCSGSWLDWGLVALAVGLGVLAKGPIILLYLLPVWLLAPWWAGSSAISLWRWYVSGLAAILAGAAIALSWALPAAAAGGDEYRQAILFGQTAGRMVASFAHQRPIYWYLQLLPALLFPWLLLPRFWWGWKNLLSDPAFRFCVAVLAPALLLLSLVSGKQVHYLVPLMPVIAILLWRIMHQGNGARLRWGLLPIIAMAMLAAAICLLPLFGMEQGGDRGILAYISPRLAIYPLLAAVLFHFCKPVDASNEIRTTARIVVFLTIAIQLGMALALRSYYEPREITAELRRLDQEGKEIAVFPARLDDQFQFAGRLTRPLVVFDDYGELALWSRENPSAFCLILTWEDGHELLAENYSKVPYTGQMLLLRPAAGLWDAYGRWLVPLQEKIDAGEPPWGNTD